MEHKVLTIVPYNKKDWCTVRNNEPSNHHNKDKTQYNTESNTSTPLYKDTTTKSRNWSKFRITLTNDPSSSRNSHIETQMTQRRNHYDNNTLTTNPTGTFRNITDEIEADLNQWNKSFKCQQLKNELILNEQKMYYGDGKKLKLVHNCPVGSFNRNQTPSIQYKPCYQYNKDNHKNKSVKYSFKSNNLNSSNNNNNNHDNIDNCSIIEHNVNKTVKTQRKERLNEVFSSPFMLEKVKKIQVEAYAKNRALSNEIKETRRLSPIKSNDNKSKSKRKGKGSEYEIIEKEPRKAKLCTNLSKSHHRRIFSWNNPETIILENAENVKKYLDSSSNKYVDQIARQMIFEDNLFNRNLGLYSEFDSKCQLVKLYKDFKKVTNKTLLMKKELKFDKATMGKKTGDFEKMKKVLKTMNGKWNDMKSIQHEHQKVRIMRTTMYINSQLHK